MNEFFEKKVRIWIKDKIENRALPKDGILKNADIFGFVHLKTETQIELLPIADVIRIEVAQ